MGKSRLCTTAEIAHELNVSEQVIRYHARRGRIPHVKTLGGHRRYDPEAVRAALARRAQRPKVERASGAPAVFTEKPIPLSELIGMQGTRPVGRIGALADPEWRDDEQERLFLRAIFHEM